MATKKLDATLAPIFEDKVQLNEGSFKDKLLHKSFSQREVCDETDADFTFKNFGAALMWGQQPSLADPVCFNNPLFSDVTIRINGEEDNLYHGHKAVLTARSEYFKTLFMNEKSWSENKTGILDITVEETNLDIFEEFLSYFYSGKITLSKDHIWPWYFLADQYLMDGLQMLVKNFISRTLLQEREMVDGELCYELLPSYTIDEAIEVALYFDDWGIKCHAGCLILANIDEIPHQQFNALHKEVLQVLLNSKTLKQPKASNGTTIQQSLFGTNQRIFTATSTDTVGQNLDEYALFRKMLMWLDSNPDRESEAENVLESIRFGRFKSLTQLREAARNKYIATSSRLSPLVSCAVQEIYFAGQQRPSHSQLKALPNAETLCKLFKPRIANEQLPFTNQ